MQTPTIGERQALDAAIAATCSEAPDPVTLTAPAHQDLRFEFLDDSNYSYSTLGLAGGFAIHRHHCYLHDRPWFVEEKRVDQHGRIWNRTFKAVVDDFGTLVEVA